MLRGNDRRVGARVIDRGALAYGGAIRISGPRPGPSTRRRINRDRYPHAMGARHAPGRGSAMAAAGTHKHGRT